MHNGSIDVGGMYMCRMVSSEYNIIIHNDVLTQIAPHTLKSSDYFVLWAYYWNGCRAIQAVPLPASCADEQTA